MSIASTPKTCAALSRPSPNGIEVDDLHEGVKQLLNEIRTGLVPPVGGRIITIRKTGEVAFVGFGSEVARSNKNGAVQARLNLEVLKIAKMRAQDALCGLISGDETSWQGGVTTEMHDSVKEFEPLTANDPISADGSGVKKLDAQRQAFVSKMQSTDVYASSRKGQLPPGVNIKTWFNDDNTWAYAMAVYIPSASDQAAQAATNMQNANIVQPLHSATGATGPSASPGTGFKDQNTPGVQRPGTDIKPGPTGKTDNDGL